MTPQFQCPQCRSAPLETSGTGWSCGPCNTLFPRIGGLPWLAPAPADRLREWRQRWRHLLLALEREQRDIERRATAFPLQSATRLRLERHAEALGAHVKALRGLLAPLDTEAASASYDTQLALRTRLPWSQDVASYYVNVHRDWCWGEAETSAELALVLGLVDQSALGRVLVLGAGAGRLAWDVHQARGEGRTTALDLNPFLAFVAARMYAGETLALHEFPIAPRDADQVAVLRELRAPGRARAGLDVVIADALRAPFSEASFDTVITPWFLDILPQPFAAVAAEVNRLLVRGGRWINFGSLAYAHADAAERLQPAEIGEQLARAGFARTESRDVEAVPYMRSPASRHARLETLFAFASTLERRLPVSPPVDPLPDWLADGARPVPLLPYFESRSLVHRIYAFVLALVDGQRSTRQIAEYLVQQRLMNPDEAESAVRDFLTQLYEESRRAPRA